MKFDRRLIFNFDWTLFLLLMLVLVIGVVNLYSAGFNISSEPLYLKQLRWAFFGFILMVSAFFIDYRLITKYAYFIHAFVVLLLVVVYFVGHVTHGSQRWIAFGPFSFQPSELAKVTVILALTKYFSDNRIEDKSYGIRELIVPFGIALVPFLLIVKQPDLGTALAILLLFGSMALFMGVRWRSLIMTAVLGILLMPLTWHFLEDYQQERILAFIDPQRDPLGSGYHIIQSIIAVGSGGVGGKGFLKGTQSQLKFLPEQQTDFVFSVFAEEWGFIGAIVLILLFLTLILWGLKVAQHSRDFIGTLIAYGVVMLIFWGVFINIGMVIGIFPVVGIPLPFMSYGGSYLMTLMTAMGLVMNVSMRRFMLQP
jgi:rod shape determining protein RodA